MNLEAPEQLKAGKVKWNRFWASYFTICYHCPQDIYGAMRVYGTAAEAHNALITHYVLAHSLVPHETVSV